jgi:thiol:disulfide interchange protein DsbD
MRLLLILLLLLLSLARAAASNTAITPRDTVSLISATNTPTNGTVTLALHFQLAPGWHIYWSNPGDAGLAPQITLDPPAQAGPLSYPPPEFLLQGPVGAYVLSGNVLLPFTATGVGNTISATATWLVCSDICVPEHASFSLQLSGGPAAEAALFTSPKIVSSPFPAQIAPDGTLSLTGPTSAQVATARFFPYAQGAIVNAAPQPLTFTTDGLALQLTTAPNFNPEKNLTGIIELTDKSGATQALTLIAAPGAVLVRTPLAMWLGLAFLGGLILNLMPCVFPILAIKALAIARLGGHAVAKVRREALGYTAGVLAAFLLLGITLLLFRAGGEQLGWGFQFQSPIFVAVIAALVLAIALNLAGAFEITGFANFGNVLAQRGSFFTGLLAVLAATPCTAPFMGGAVAAALAAPSVAALGIFVCLGLGLAAPVLLLAVIPAIAAIFPRPGAWMLYLQRALSIPMFATFIWLGWVLIHETTTSAAPLTLPGAEPFSADRLASLRHAGQPVFIDITAAWCVTCLVNERASLTAPAVQSAFTAAHIHVLVGDWTNRDPAITAYLQSNHRDGVPLYVFYPAGGGSRILPQILTPTLVTAALTPAPSQPVSTPAPGG